MGRGFTIIELLIVMALIALLASLVLATIGSTRERSRDARREADIKEIQNALDLYSVTNRAFPICASEVVINGESDCLSVQLIAVGAAGQVADVRYGLQDHLAVGAQHKSQYTMR